MRSQINKNISFQSLHPADYMLIVFNIKTCIYRNLHLPWQAGNHWHQLNVDGVSVIALPLRTHLFFHSYCCGFDPCCFDCLVSASDCRSFLSVMQHVCVYYKADVLYRRKILPPQGPSGRKRLKTDMLCHGFHQITAQSQREKKRNWQSKPMQHWLIAWLLAGFGKSEDGKVSSCHPACDLVICFERDEEENVCWLFFSVVILFVSSRSRTRDMTWMVVQWRKVVYLGDLIFNFKKCTCQINLTNLRKISSGESCSFSLILCR